MKEYSGKTIESILDDIVNQEQVNKDDIIYKVKDQSGFAMFSKVSIEAYTYKDVINEIESYIKDVLLAMEYEVSIETTYENNDYLVNINTNNNSLVIGYNGKNLYALETLVRQMLSNKFHARIYIRLDVNNYFKDKESKLTRLAYKLAAEVGKTKTDMKLDPMPNYDRKIIHRVLKEVHYVNTKSYGEGKDRYLIIHYDLENDLKHNNKYGEVEIEKEDNNE